ncbi:ATP-binding protein, partial [Candidatus Dependentiae bacterium]|nr:ATP-binding protein [Candidatus Dependentiae bacterium]
MARIKQLSPQEAQKIAAGEVVERPANVVKELIENALDAGATQITIYIEEAGKKLIQVIDNGCGMDAQDARMCIKHHATSKITSVTDLEHIATFGFRGEALSSISSVSKVVLTTKEADATAGITLEVSDGIIHKETVTACNTGTEIAIHDLFYNVPARKKFLKA